MSKKTEPAATETATLVALPEVVAGIKKAERAAGTMLSETREAARKASEQLNHKVPIDQRIAEVMACYETTLKGVNHNIRAIFKDVITLRAAESCPVSVDVIGKDGKKVEAHIAAAEAVDLPKHALRAAAQEVREVHGLGRKKGAGRKAEAPKDVPAAPDVARGDEDSFQHVLAELDNFLTDSVYLDRIKAHLAEKGFVISKAVQGRRVAGKAAA
jgi:hypothetical protein